MRQLQGTTHQHHHCRYLLCLFQLHFCSLHLITRVVHVSPRRFNILLCGFMIHRRSGEPCFALFRVGCDNFLISFADMGAMSPRMKALAQSQDKIGYRNFMEGHILIHFYEVQNFHLAMSSSFLNGAAWAKQFISKILHITHSQ